MTRGGRGPRGSSHANSADVAAQVRVTRPGPTANRAHPYTVRHADGRLRSCHTNAAPTTAFRPAARARTARGRPRKTAWASMSPSRAWVKGNGGDARHQGRSGTVRLHGRAGQRDVTSER